MDCGLVKSKFYDGSKASMTTTNMVLASNKEGNREELCEESPYIKGYIIYLGLNPIILTNELIEDIPTLPEELLKNNLCTYRTLHIFNTAQVSDDIINTFKQEGQTRKLDIENVKYGFLTMDNNNNRVIVKYSRKSIDDFIEEIELHNRVAELNAAPKILGYRACLESDIGNSILITTRVSNSGELNILEELKGDGIKFLLNIVEFVARFHYEHHITFNNLSVDDNFVLSDEDYTFYVYNLNKAKRYSKEEFNKILGRISRDQCKGEDKFILATDYYQIMEDIRKMTWSKDIEEIIKLIKKNSLNIPFTWNKMFREFYKNQGRVMNFEELIAYVRYLLTYEDMRDTLFGVLNCPYGDILLERIDKKSVASIKIDSGTPILPYNLQWAYGTLNDKSRVVIRKLENVNIEKHLYYSDIAYNNNLSTEILSAWKCPPHGVLIMRAPEGIYYTKAFTDNLDHMYDIYLQTIAAIYKLNWYAKVQHNDAENMYIYLEKGDPKILGFSDKSSIFDVDNVIRAYNGNGDIEFDPFYDIKIVSERFTSLDIDNEKYRMFCRKINMYLSDTYTIMHIHRSLYSINQEIPSVELFINIMQEQIRPKRLLNLGPLKYNMSKTSSVFEIVGENCGVDSDYDPKCKANILPLEELREIRIENMIAEGAFGKIYRGIYRDKPIAFKYTSFNNPQGNGLSYFSNEICNQDLAAKRYLSPRVLSYWKCDKIDKGIIIMDYIHGSSLNHCLENPNFSSILMEVMATYMYLNLEVNILNRDSHIGNVIVSSNDVYIIDYGWSTISGDFDKTMQKLGSVDFSQDEIKDITDCYILFADIIAKIVFVKFNAYALYNAIVYNRLNTGREWYNLYNSIYRKLQRKPNWIELYDMVRPNFNHLIDRNIPDPLSVIKADKFYSLDNEYEYQDLTFLKKMSYSRMEKVSHCTYYYGSIGKKKITVALSTESNQFDSHVLAYTKTELAPKILGYFVINEILYMFVYENEEDSANITEISNGKDILNLYIDYLTVYLTYNLKYKAVHRSAMCYCTGILNGKAIINKFPSIIYNYSDNLLIKDIIDKNQKPQYLVDHEDLTLDFIKMIDMSKVPHKANYINVISSRAKVMDVINDLYYTKNRIPAVEDVIKEYRSLMYRAMDEESQRNNISL